MVTSRLVDGGAQASQAGHAVFMAGVCKSFGPVEVLHGVDFDLRHGEVHALLGGNGAGKSTLMKILQGVHRPDAGEIYVNGTGYAPQSPAEAASAGIGMIFQEFSLIPTLSVARNIFLGREPRRFGLIDDGAISRRAAELLRWMGSQLDPGRTVNELPVGYWQLTEIAKALSLDARVLIMDEPTASLPYSEVEHLFALIERLKGQGLSIIYISHRMAEISRIADRLTVIRDGHNVLTDDVAKVSSERVVESIVGRGTLRGLLREQRPNDDDRTPVLEVRDANAGQSLVDVSFDLAQGEVVGLAGLMGSGRTELARCLFGMDRLESGTITLDGEPLRIRSPQDAIDAGIMLVPEDRQLQGLVLEHTVRANLLLPSLGRLNAGPLLKDRRGQALCQNLMARLSIRASAINEPVSSLSGGNQQKVVISKWLGLQQVGHASRVLILDEPTRGVDIAAKTEILQLVLDMADAGVAIVVISSELEELLSVCDRVLVMRNGHVEANLDRDDIPDEPYLQLAVQGVQA